MFLGTMDKPRNALDTDPELSFQFTHVPATNDYDAVACRKIKKTQVTSHLKAQRLPRFPI